MTKKLLFSVFVLLVICLTSEIVSADGQQTAAAGPSLEETLLFLANAVANEGRCGGHGGLRDMVCMQSVLERNGSILTLTSGLIPRGGRPPQESYELILSKEIDTFDLKALDPSAVTLIPQGGLCVHMVSSNGVKAVSRSFPNSDDPGDRMGGHYTEVDVWFATKETAQRAAKAFQHAIEMAGGKASAF